MKISKSVSKIMAVLFITCGFFISSAYAKGSGKIGYVDIRRTFYEYDKTKEMENKLKTAAEAQQNERKEMVKEITKLRDEVELLIGDTKAKKQEEIDVKLEALQEFDRKIRQDILTQKNDMFREVIDDIQAIVETMGAKSEYDYILDSRNIMYAKEDYDLTKDVLKQLNKKESKE